MVRADVVFYIWTIPLSRCDTREKIPTNARSSKFVLSCPLRYMHIVPWSAGRQEYLLYVVTNRTMWILPKLLHDSWNIKLLANTAKRDAA